MFWDAPDLPSVCHQGGPHSAKATTFVFPTSVGDDGQHQDLWFRCRKCARVFNNSFEGQKGICPAGDEHIADELAVTVAHATFDVDIDRMDTWRFCHKCAGLVCDDFRVKNHCKAGGRHEAMGLEFVLPHEFNVDEGAPHPPHPQEDDHHRRDWYCCGKCGGMFWKGTQATSHCPADEGNHEPASDPRSSQEFFLPHDLSADSTHQDQWQFCTMRDKWRPGEWELGPLGYAITSDLRALDHQARACVLVCRWWCQAGPGEPAQRRLCRTRCLAERRVLLVEPPCRVCAASDERSGDPSGHAL
jgi:hypothetical protein